MGLTWDHALCDVGGASLLLSRLSAVYTGAEPLPPPLDHSRQEQRSLMVTDERDERVSPSSAAAAPPPKCRSRRKRWGRCRHPLLAHERRAAPPTQDGCLGADAPRRPMSGGHSAAARCWARRAHSVHQPGRTPPQPYDVALSFWERLSCIVFAALPLPAACDRRPRVEA